MFEINDELKQVQNGLLSSQSIINNVTNNNNTRPFSNKSNRTYNTNNTNTVLSLKDALFHKKYQPDNDYSSFPIIEQEKKD